MNILRSLELKTVLINVILSADYKRDFSRSVRIEFIGVWDTVPSVGALFPRILPFSADNHITKTFRHALSLDEHRAAFQQNNWHRTVDDTPPGKNGTPHAGVMRTSLGMIWRLLTFWWKRKPLKVIPAMSGKPTHVKASMAIFNKTCIITLNLSGGLVRWMSFR